MALPTNHKFTEVQVEAYTPSAGASPSSCSARAPFRGRVIKLGATLQGTLTGDATVTCTIAGTSITIPTFTLTASGSVNGTTFSVIPTGANNCNEDDYISFVSTSGSGANIPCLFWAVIDKSGTF
jgi:hypothetical protein